MAPRSVRPEPVERLITKHLDLWTTAIKRRSTAGRGSSSKVELYGIKKLRELILELAVRGLLVPQDPSDEPASELLKKIAAEKAKLVKVGKIKNEKSLPPVATEEMPFDLPKNWCWARLGEVTNYGFGDKAEPADVNENTWVLELEDVEKETSKLLQKVRFSEREFKSSKNIFNVGDVIYGKLRPYLDKVLVADEDGVCTTEMIPVRAHAVITPAFLRLSMKSPGFIAYADSATHGMNLPRVGTDKARMALIPICSEASQHRIVAKVDELMALCDQLEQQTDASLSAHQTLAENLLDALASAAGHKQFISSWQRIAEHFDTLFTTEESIDQLKQTILQLAVMGKLVPQDPNDEPASELLKKIAAEQAKLVKEGKIKADKPLPPISDAEIPFELPKGWLWVRLPNVSFFQEGPGIMAKDFRDKGVPLIRISGMHGPVVSLEGCNYLEEEMVAKKWNHFRLEEDDIVLSSSASLGKVSKVKNDAIGSIAYTGLIRFKPFKSVFDEYLIRFFGSGEFVRQIDGSKRGAAILHFGPTHLRGMIVPIPPFPEQHRIVAKVGELMALCDQLKARLGDAQITQLNLADGLTEQALG